MDTQILEKRTTPNFTKFFFILFSFCFFILFFPKENFLNSGVVLFSRMSVPFSANFISKQLSRFCQGGHHSQTPRGAFGPRGTFAGAKGPFCAFGPRGAFSPRNNFCSGAESPSGITFLPEGQTCPSKLSQISHDSARSQSRFHPEFPSHPRIFVDQIHLPAKQTSG